MAVKFRCVIEGYWTVEVDGVDRPITAVRDWTGRWVIQSCSATVRDAKLWHVHGETKTLKEAKPLMVRIWDWMRTARDLAHYEAIQEAAQRG
jgi:hypothetical protein